MFDFLPRQVFVRLNSSIAKKQILALSGLGLCTFLVAHLAGNCLIYVGPEAFNLYAHALIENPFIYVAEAGLALLFLTHIGLALHLTWLNREARGVQYNKKVPTGRGATMASSTMPLTGLTILIFLVLHIWHFKFGPYYYAEYDGLEVRDLYRLVVEYFQNPLAVGWYLLAMAALGLHLGHGVWSAFQSLGWHHPQYHNCCRFSSRAFALIVALGFAALPVYCYLQGEG